MTSTEDFSAQILSKLISVRSVVGTPNDQMIAMVDSIASAHGVEVVKIPGPDSGRSNILMTIGPRNVAGIVLSAHLDVVPANEPGWEADPFYMRTAGDRLIGRGATDMKGFAAAVLALLPNFVAADLKKPVHICFSYDEEAGCRGVPHLIAEFPKLLRHIPTACIVGEPTGLKPVLSHKGKTAAKLKYYGLTGHSSRPELGVNAIHKLLTDAKKLISFEKMLREQGPTQSSFEPPYTTLQVGTISGGSAVNVIPEYAELELEIRAVPELNPADILKDLEKYIDNKALKVEVTSHYPGFSIDPKHQLVETLVRISGHQPIGSVSFGTEAGVYAASGIPAIVCGPGDVDRAHKAEEFITRNELVQCCNMLESLISDLSEDE